MTQTTSSSLSFLSGIAVSGASDVGRVRAVNEDSFTISSEARLLMVADGVGGHGQGDRASRLAVSAVVDNLLAYEFENRHAVKNAVGVANALIFAENQQRGVQVGRGMGTTVAGLWFPPGRRDTVTVFSVGDSRVYRLRGGRIERLTQDHSLYQDWLDNGSSGKAPARNVITRCVGSMPDVDVDVLVVDTKSDEKFVLCSDGLTTMIEDTEILNIVSGSSDVEMNCSRLVAAARERGGRDNVTVIVASFV
ncbi:MAG: serine/threonine-protein phosphatase [Alphaproteobacteria bacterium]|nr:serine/threonine-protein phosphatase [Alphaproteobacteria bacterium]